MIHIRFQVHSAFVGGIANEVSKIFCVLLDFEILLGGLAGFRLSNSYLH